MILSHGALTSLNMSSYRAILTHFSPNSMIFINLILQLLASGTCPRYIHHRFTTGPPQVHERCIIIRLTIGSRQILVPKSWLWVHKIVFTGSPPDTLADGLQPPVPPCILRGSASRALRTSWYQDLGTKILVPRSWYQDPGTKILVPRSWMSP